MRRAGTQSRKISPPIRGLHQAERPGATALFFCVLAPWRCSQCRRRQLPRPEALRLSGRGACAASQIVRSVTFCRPRSMLLTWARSTPMRSATASWLRPAARRYRRRFRPKTSRMSIGRMETNRVFCCYVLKCADTGAAVPSASRLRRPTRSGGFGSAVAVFEIITPSTFLGCHANAASRATCRRHCADGSHADRLR